MKIERGSWSLPISWLKPSCHMRFQPAFTACVCVFSNKLCWFEPTNRFTLKTQQDAVKILWNTRVATCLKGIYVIIIVFSMGNNVEPRFSYSTQKSCCVFVFWQSQQTMLIKMTWDQICLKFCVVQWKTME